jgi:hypothetical protein
MPLPVTRQERTVLLVLAALMVLGAIGLWIF